MFTSANVIFYNDYLLWTLCERLKSYKKQEKHQDFQQRDDKILGNNISIIWNTVVSYFHYQKVIHILTVITIIIFIT